VRKRVRRTFRLSKELDTMLCTRAKELGLSVSEVLRMVLATWLMGGHTQVCIGVRQNLTHDQTPYTHTDYVQAYAKHNDLPPLGPDPEDEDEGTEPPEIPEVPKELGEWEDLLTSDWASILVRKGRDKHGK